MLDARASPSQRSRISASRRPLSPESLIVLFGSAGWISLSLPTKLCHTWHWFRRLHSAIEITSTTRVKAVLSRTRRTLLEQGSLCCTHRSITSVGYTSLSIVILTCSHTLSSTSISRNLYCDFSHIEAVSLKHNLAALQGHKLIESKRTLCCPPASCGSKFTRSRISWQ